MDNFKMKFNNLLIDKLGVSQEDIKPDAKFTEDLGADSLDMVELIMEFEKEFNLAIPDEDTETLNTVSDAEDYLKNKLS
ncbi:acyl carrier protein [bacterium]|nr:acyl carrier protein [bacterium]